MKSLNFWILIACCLVFSLDTNAKNNPDNSGNKPANENTQTQYQTHLRAPCSTGSAQFDQGKRGTENVNNVRARLLINGDVWWDGSSGKYVVPNVPPGVPEVSSIFAGSVWLGGFDDGGNLKVAAKTYGFTNDTDFWPGPLLEDDEDTEDINEAGTTEAQMCDDWDKFFEVYADEIDQHLANYQKALNNNEPYNPDDIPMNVKGWPARGNPHFFNIHRFILPDNSQGLGSFWDEDGDGAYIPENGDYPIIEIRGCADNPQYPDQMVFWIYNDAGNTHTQSNGDAIQMEIQVQAFSYKTNDEVNDMTFQRYKLINRAAENINETYFAMWVDPDLGCSEDDFIGCDTSRSMAFVYNQDALDGASGGCTCDGGVNTYCDRIPVLGIDYFRGPLDEFGNELGMSSFTYFNRAGVGPTLSGQNDPNGALEYYRYLSGLWADGTPFTYGGSGYNPASNETINYAFTEDPNDVLGWSMCTEELPFGDRRTVQASGPFVLQPGDVNELIIGVVWVPDMDYPCPNISKLKFADDIAQSLFDNCFQITNGPDAPDLDWVEMDQEIICIMSNDSITSNNYNESYVGLDLRAPDGVDQFYRFEGYKVFQLATNEDVVGDDLNDPEKARLVFQCDLKNGVNTIFNWFPIEDPNSSVEVWVPEAKVEGADEGISHTFKIETDQFSTGNNRDLVNHKKYYYKAVSYAYNNYLPYNATEGIGQRFGYLEGRRNIEVYTVIPRPIIDVDLNSVYGDGPIITRIDGEGVGSNFLKISPETENIILEGNFDGDIIYQPGAGPVDIRIYNPLEIQPNKFQLTFFDANMDDSELAEDARWKLTNLNNTDEIIFSEKNINEVNEQLIAQYGFSISVQQTCDTGGAGFDIDLEEIVCQESDDTNGAIGFELNYAQENNSWFDAVPDIDFGFPGINEFIFPLNFMKTEANESEWRYDPTGSVGNIADNRFYPYKLVDWRTDPTFPYLTPAFTDRLQTNSTASTNVGLDALNNVDIVFTKDKSKWSRCIVIETANLYYTDANIQEALNVDTELDPEIAEAYNINDGIFHFDVRGVPSVGKNDSNNDGIADRDNEVDEDGNPLMGYGWFPGYAIDVETGERLNVFFGENSTYNDQIVDASTYDDGRMIGRDMIWNPTQQRLLTDDALGFTNDPYRFFAGGQHHIYVTNTRYDSCHYLHDRLRGNQLSPTKKVAALKSITWTSMPVLLPGTKLLSYNEGLIPNDLRVSLRVDNPYNVVEIPASDEYKGYPTYEFEFKDVSPTELTDSLTDVALDAIGVVPNPYYGYSAYEVSQYSNVVKITNLPAKCNVKIFSLDGKFIREYRRDEVGESQQDRTNAPINRTQYAPDIEWDLKNSKGIPIASGVYLIHVDADGLGERVIKWFGIAREFDPSGL